MDLLLVFPGQGSQKPGMARDLADAYPAARAALDSVDGALGDSPSLSSLMFDGPADTLTLTHNAQPALLAHAAAAWASVSEAVRPHVRAAAGHSLGEFSAYHAAGSLSLADAVRLVRERGDLMFKTGVERPGAMAAILGSMTRSADDVCREASEAGLVVPANFNSDDQLVLSGEVTGVERAMELAKAAGAKRAVRLNVSGAFHSPLMEPAVDGLRRALDACTWADPAWPVYSNVNAVPNRSAGAARDLLVRQLSSPVRWVELIRKMSDDFPGATFVELGPGGVLAGLIKRIVPGARCVACGTGVDASNLLSLVRT